MIVDRGLLFWATLYKGRDIDRRVADQSESITLAT